MNYKIKKNDSSSVDDKSQISFIPYEPLWNLDEVIMGHSVRESIEDAISFCVNESKIISEWHLDRFLKGSGGCLGINMHGNPGTGKSIAAEAIAKAIGKKIIRVKLSEMVDSLQGQTEKNLSKLFDTAQNEGHIILFDEADSLLSKRSSGTNNSDATNLIKSHLLNLLDRNKVIVIFTTNFFKNYDRAFVRRILFNIHFPDPTKEELVRIWKFHLTPEVPKNVSYEDISEISEGLTGGDVRHLTLKICTRLSSRRIVDLNKETMKQIIEDYKNSIKTESIRSEEKEIQITDINNKLN